MSTNFEALNQAAFDRGGGREDAFRAWETTEDGHHVFCPNPHKNNSATQEAVYWQEGYNEEIAELSTK